MLWVLIRSAFLRHVGEALLMSTHNMFLWRNKNNIYLHNPLIRDFVWFHALVPGSILSSRQTKTDTCANSVDPDETARNEPSHQDLQFAILFLILHWNPYLRQ